MRIAVLSPVSHGSGSSVVSLLIALRLGQGSDRVCLTHVSPTDTALRDVVGAGGVTDRTTTPSMIIRAMQSTGSMTEEDCSQYCAAVTREVDLLTCTRSGDVAVSSADARYLAKYAALKFPHKHVVVDVDDHSTDAVREVVGYCDCVVIAIRTSRLEIKALSVWLKDFAASGALAGKRVLIVCNRYSDIIIKQKELAALLGVKQAIVHVLPLSPYVAWAEFNSKFVQFWQFIKKSDTRVTDVRIELDKLAKSLRQKVAPVKKRAPALRSVVHPELDKSGDLISSAPTQPQPVQDSKYSQLPQHSQNSQYSQAPQNPPPSQFPQTAQYSQTDQSPQIPQSQQIPQSPQALQNPQFTQVPESVPEGFMGAPDPSLYSPSISDFGARPDVAAYSPPPPISETVPTHDQSLRDTSDFLSSNTEVLNTFGGELFVQSVPIDGAGAKPRITRIAKRAVKGE